MNFTPITQGKLEWWARTDTKSRLITQLQSYSSNGTLTAEWMGFNSTGNFVYYDGSNKVNTSATYQLNRWYHFTVLFDTASQKKTILISDEAGQPLVFDTDIAFRDPGMGSVNRLRFSTISTDVGVHHIDDIRISDRMEEDLSGLTGIRLHQQTYMMTMGQSAALQVLGTFTDGSLNPVSSGNVYTSSHPETVAVQPDGLIQAIGTGKRQ
ncbi:hypothetical protein N6H14_13935 [Paenibacillus sp. CC-CFT747]|nr:hypothetical protein N6H14_13935 [Paenibacillus sp. CC-CFT747]